MNIEEVRDYCLKLKNAEESFPFGEDTLVFKVEGKMFLAMSLNDEDPHDEALLLRDRYKAVVPAHHFNKKHWNDIYLNRDMNDHDIRRWILHSYESVILQLPAAIRRKYEYV